MKKGRGTCLEGHPVCEEPQSQDDGHVGACWLARYATNMRECQLHPWTEQWQNFPWLAWTGCCALGCLKVNGDGTTSKSTQAALQTWNLFQVMPATGMGSAAGRAHWQVN
jgi:hypothetical protein